MSTTKNATVETEAIRMTTINPLLFNFACFASRIYQKTDIYYLDITPIFAVIRFYIFDTRPTKDVNSRQERCVCIQYSPNKAIVYDYPVSSQKNKKCTFRLFLAN